MFDPDDLPPTAEERSAASQALLEQLTAREGLGALRPLLADLVPSLFELTLELERQKDEKVSTPEDRRAMAQRAIHAFQGVVLGHLGLVESIARHPAPTFPPDPDVPVDSGSS